MNPTIHPDRPSRRPQGMTAAELVAYEMRYVVPDNGCLLTTAHLNSAGYGHVRLGPRMVLLHRLVLEEELNRHLASEDALHRCHRPQCINPKHLYPGSHADNMADMARAGRGRSGGHLRFGQLNNAAKLTDAKVRDIRLLAISGKSYRAIGRQYQVTHETIRKIVDRLTWKHVED